MNKFNLMKSQGFLPPHIITELENIEKLKTSKCGTYRSTLRKFVDDSFERVDGKLLAVFDQPVITKSATKTNTNFQKTWHAGVLREEVEAGGMSSDTVDKLVREGKYKEAKGI